MMKQIVFNALQTSLSGGIGRYSYELAKNIYKLNKVDLKIVIREEDKHLFRFAEKEDLVIAKGIDNSKSRNYYEQFKLPDLINELYPEAIVHYPDSMAPLFAKNKVVITVHDLAFKSLKNVFTLKTTLWKNLITDLSIKKANKIITITNFVKDEILKYYNVDSNRISVVYNGFNNFSKDSIELKNISNNILKFSNKPYILTVSTISPRKNIDGLIKAFNLIKDKINCDLVVAGKNGWMYEDIFKLVKDLNIENRVTFTGGINDDELKSLYKNANTFIYPSFYEGFGLPPLEAMSYGIPCIVSNADSLLEVVGDAAFSINPHVIEAISNGIVQVYSDSKLREAIVNKGFERIEKFSWEMCARIVATLY
ncbi:glycosyltransferase family 4 protein [Clostridium pasteurianum]|uniref:Glycosyltransferase n=1 Tax=Clostridium pasteurianum BC1 TaxID=86416 RepID=R4JZW1_CLOPA|nr:glycosyltransferase family 1 protein [Clostridium pasteurianum]AGK95863.1 glycosyltransferase [Clostridium pasteurianum BC1]